MRAVLAAAVVPALVLGAAWLPEGSGDSAAAARVAAPFLAGLGLFPVAFAAGRGRWILGSAILAAACGGVMVAIRREGVQADEGTAVGWVAITFATLFGLSLPFLTLGWRGVAATVWLVLAALACGTLLLARPEQGAISPPLLTFNPLVRIFWHGLGFDWLHAANVYPRIGSVYYRYPERTDGVVVTLALAAGGMVLGGLMALATRRARAAA